MKALSILSLCALIFGCAGIARAQNVAPFLISGHPQNSRIFVGGSAAFTVQTNPKGAASYQWFFNGQSLATPEVRSGLGITGWDTRTLTIAVASERHLGKYYVKVSDLDYPRGIDSQAASLTVEPARLINISTRAFVGPGGLAVGFVIRGQTKRILVRAIGPSLAAFGITDALPNPSLELISGGRVVGSNDDWRVSDSGAFVGVGAFPLGSGSLDAALIGTAAAGNYTVEVKASEAASSANLAKSGTVLVEVYEVD